MKIPAVYEMCRIAHFTCFRNIISGVISFPYNELALPVQRIYTSANLRHCGCDCNIRKRGLYEGKGCFSVFPRKLRSGKTVFSGQRAIPQSLWERIDEYSRLPGFENACLPAS
jgi:hypothetical protein